MSDNQLSVQEKDIIGELGNISMGSAATALSGLLNRKVEITVPQVELISVTEVEKVLPEKHLMIKVEYQEGFTGSNILLIKEKDALFMVALMMQQEEPMEGLDELGMSALGEAMNQMMGSASTALSDFLGKKIIISPPEIIWQKVEEAEKAWFRQQEGDYLVKTTFRLVVEGVIDSFMLQLLPLSFAREMVASLQGEEQEQTLPEEEETVSQATSGEVFEEELAEEEIEQAEAPPIKEKKEVKAKTVEFGQFREEGKGAKKANLDLIMDVSLPIAVELGRTRLLVREILNLGPGSILELEKLAGEPADLYVNDILFARGEVVVIEENFGVRITEIISPEERMKNAREAQSSG